MPWSRPTAMSWPRGAEAADEVLRLAGSGLRTLCGSRAGLSSGAVPSPSSTTASIIREAMRDDTESPLLYAAGGG